MKSFTSGLYIAFATSILGGLGCGATGPEEPVSEVHEAINVGNWSALVGMGTTGSYTLTANINAAGQTWTPKTFSGTLDGANFAIQNLTISGGSFFSSLTNATVRRLRFTNLTITGGSTPGIGGLAISATDTTIDRCSIEANINVSATQVGGILGTMTGGSIFRSYAKGSITGSTFFAGGLVGIANKSSVGQASISESYAQVTVNPSTPEGWPVIAGGLVGHGYAPIISDSYAVGNVTGRGGVGGIIGNIDCTFNEDYFQLYKTIYRGDVVDRNWSSSGGWSGGVGTFSDQECDARFVQNFYDRSLDASTNRAAHQSIRGYTTDELRSPTSVIGGVFCEPMDPVPGRCGDNTWSSPPWTAGTSTQHHVLQGMPGPNSQPR
jgi:hypothetical protein